MNGYEGSDGMNLNLSRTDDPNSTVVYSPEGRPVILDQGPRQRRELTYGKALTYCMCWAVVGVVHSLLLFGIAWGSLVLGWFVPMWLVALLVVELAAAALWFRMHTTTAVQWACLMVFSIVSGLTLGTLPLESLFNTTTPAKGGALGHEQLQ